MPVRRTSRTDAASCADLRRAYLAGGCPTNPSHPLWAHPDCVRQRGRMGAQGCPGVASGSAANPMGLAGALDMYPQQKTVLLAAALGVAAGMTKGLVRYAALGAAASLVWPWWVA